MISLLAIFSTAFVSLYAWLMVRREFNLAPGNLAYLAMTVACSGTATVIDLTSLRLPEAILDVTSCAIAAWVLWRWWRKRPRRKSQRATGRVAVRGHRLVVVPAGR